MSTPAHSTHGEHAPLTTFTECHVGILRRLKSLDALPALLEPAAQARQIAADSLAFFREAIFEHHLDEERDLFPAVLASAQAGAERERVQAMTERLTCEHRAIETLWKSLEKGLKRVGKGQDADLDVDDLHQLVSAYAAHAAFEEKDFLPLSETILSRNSNHMAALGLSLHMRHVRQIPAHI
ncbi:hemerythrin domain-containing protein [Hydrogenophaga sp.]|uniref:hemerythrin domain-containing protein n=1 Tax=Hydrogenophaga sp. TaxID=1904254 RepID=UPI002730C899|nr:hemerythrin domain-containing protein [Hydrogenophaga sp.]MDP2017908.1 hemerythrin domain-containing protein [Hydrogenophaga sp.]MDP3812970.1 hemerythrin domain-containing protein [Hydrogenophaga sp.]